MACGTKKLKTGSFLDGRHMTENNSQPIKLQIALDGTYLQGVKILHEVHPFVDIVEVGTPLLFREGIQAVTLLRQQFPDVEILADLKIVDAGEAEASIAFEAGCDYVTVLGVASDTTINGVLVAARKFDGKVMVDMMQVIDVLDRSRQMLSMGCHIVCVHTGYDLQQAGDSIPLEHLRQLREALPEAPLAAAGGIGLVHVTSLKELHPQIVIVGGAITQANDPAAAASALKRRLSGR
jgi:3-hexulose-6-phosphate synthase